MTTALRLAPGTRVTLDDPEFSNWTGTVVVCLCKRHKWQRQVGDGGPGRECGHARCGYPRAASACPWPVHVRWDGGDPNDPNESHQSPDDLTILTTTGN
ncbi:hypothetical protein DMB38_20530 [Streptomyces sp. WAC 06738]|uniref:hypothetical protein n=1 Tax=Streptomyces sp. WAC 06738 TaxID=2203210 RepID=UPI000F6B5F0B|nr:hypothetical protein [Streptomyces sp. WAC 06738]AZM47857.1 hypothetical protein DMB38_20530 [Streptomyces sp. WAC 06738]